MKDFKALIERYKLSFLDGNANEEHDYETLAEGQSPNIMVISCCDSRVSPDLIFSAKPGEIFTVRNVANLVPPFEEKGEFHGTSAALEFAVTGLKISHIVILGHSTCGGVKDCLDHAMGEEDTTHFIGSWMSIIKDVAEKAKEIVAKDKTASDIQLVTELEAIKESIQNLQTFPFINDAIDAGQLDIHGLHFDIGSAQLRILDKETEQFQILS